MQDVHTTELEFHSEDAGIWTYFLDKGKGGKDFALFSILKEEWKEGAKLALKAKLRKKHSDL